MMCNRSQEAVINSHWKKICSSIKEHLRQSQNACLIKENFTMLILRKSLNSTPHFIKNK